MKESEEQIKADYLISMVLDDKRIMMQQPQVQWREFLAPHHCICSQPSATPEDKTLIERYKPKHIT